MKLGDLIPDTILPMASAIGHLEITGIQDDSRKVKPGNLFFAVPGLTVDGHDFIPLALRAGAAAIVTSLPFDSSVPCLVVDNPVRVMAAAAARWEGEPAKHLTLLGITGTNGKTTTTYLIEAILAAAGHRPGVVGTITYRYAGKSKPAPFTTPTPLILQNTLRQMKDAECSHVVTEVSSHALQLGRVWGLDFHVAAFSHLTQDHLDLHGDMENYLQAKQLLFSRHLASGGTAVINMDGAGAECIEEVVKKRGDVKWLRCSTTGQPADASLQDIKHNVQGIQACLQIENEAIAIQSRLLGAYNADNILLASACCYALGISLDHIALGVAQLKGVPGRLERVDEANEFPVVVDYAHTPDALERAIAVLRPLCRGRLIVIFGCGGDRDRRKRPLMGQAVARGANIAVVTSDNPRTEDPQAIIEMILEGIRGVDIPQLQQITGDHGYYVESDRRWAIAAAIQAARSGDIVLIAGKGHEDYQILGKNKIYFDDREEARKALLQR